MAEKLDNPPVLDALLRFKPPSWSANKWAVEAKVSRTVWSDIRRHGNPTRNTLEKLLAVAGSSVAEFEALRVDAPTTGNALTVRTEVRGTGMKLEDVERAWRGSGPSKPVPLVGSAVGGEFTDDIELTELHLAEVFDYLARPHAVANDKKAYALTIVGDSMAPRFEPGERVFVSPRSPVGIGDDVIVQLKDCNGTDDLADRITMVLIKRLVRRTAKHVELRQFNPDRTFTVPLEQVAEMHRVSGRL